MENKERVLRPYEQSGVAVTSRSAGEYEAMFALDDLKGIKGPVLDVAAGASSFQAEACAMGLNVLSADPRYGMEPADLAALGQAEIEAADGKIRRLAEQYDWSFYGSADAHKAMRQSALERFLDHYARHRDRYAAAALPALPFADASFALVLCSHFLFLYGDTFDERFHREAITEMYRLLTPGGEIRVYPTVTLRWEPYPHLDPVLEPIREAGAIVDMRQGRLPFMPKPSPILVVRKPD